MATRCGRAGRRTGSFFVDFFDKFACHWEVGNNLKNCKEVFLGEGRCVLNFVNLLEIYDKSMS
ncbi:MAG: hypothetical protein BM485_08620 [Desulfobulbaceae bacterium DB1]|nr:MAG: hypothetical protein BM485_08620 [Desulfobulbaceae bacterium DB1]